MKWFNFQGHSVLLNIPNDKLPGEEGHRFQLLENCQVTSENLYLVYGDVSHLGLGIGFTYGKKDAYAAVTIVYRDGIGYVYFPNDSDWLEILQMLLQWNAGVTGPMLLQLTSYAMQLAVGKTDVTMDDMWKLFTYLGQCCSGLEKCIYDTLQWWILWFFYACIAEENYISVSGKPTMLGGLVKIVALIECIYEGWSVRDACDHYKVDCYHAYGGGSGIVSDVISKCQLYGIERKC